MKAWIISLAVLCFLSQEGQTAEVCYGDLGCFTNDPPYDNSPHLPEDPAVVATGFWLYTSSNRVFRQVIDRNDLDSLLNSNFDMNKDSKFLIHGWTNSGEEDWVVSMKNAFLDSTEELNVFAVDWNGGAAVNYPQAVSNTQIVGAEVDAFIRFLDDALGGYPPSKVHLIGHSLGAQCSGHAGERSPDIGRITGLDPAGPDFEGRDPAVRIDPTDAVFVDVIHTDGEPNESALGIKMACGDADFYPNGGENQPGCLLSDSDLCDHDRAGEYFEESINSECKFTSYPCELDQWFSCPVLCCNTCNPYCAQMGYDAVPEETGIFHLETNSQSPYCQD
ncbi:pancreatic lipase-related protein 2-like [Glandiceps talaboti]